jgi:hypothetical protein
MALVQVGVMEHLHWGVPLSPSLNWGYLQLALFALIFGGLQVWWINSTLRKGDLARPLSEGEFRKTMERIWAKKT